MRALGLLPDEGDILQRYLALRRFWKEAKQFGAQRRASERLAAEDGLSNLAITAGFSDLAGLEWAMEAQLAQEIDPTTRRWSIGDYIVRIGSDEKASLIVERNGQPLKAVPASVREAPEYEEIKEARELLKAQWQPCPHHPGGAGGCAAPGPPLLATGESRSGGAPGFHGAGRRPVSC